MLLNTSTSFVGLGSDCSKYDRRQFLVPTKFPSTRFGRFITSRLPLSASFSSPSESTQHSLQHTTTPTLARRGVMLLLVLYLITLTVAIPNRAPQQLDNNINKRVASSSINASEARRASLARGSPSQRSLLTLHPAGSDSTTLHRRQRSPSCTSSQFLKGPFDISKCSAFSR